MTQGSPLKLLPRNAAALRRGQDAASAIRIVAGNPVAARLESGVGNCFPGLECDLRNLERRFFPFLEIETDFSRLLVASVNLDGVEAARADGTIDDPTAANYQSIATGIDQGATWTVARMEGDFGPLGHLDFALNTLTPVSTGPTRLPSDAWTAVRLLTESSPVTVTLTRDPGPGRLTLTGPRARYLDDTGALARMFEPGELTQSLCSPWTHDFRDCACFYWASNHPDIALPPLPTPSPAADDQRWNLATSWEREDRSIQSPPVATANGGAPELEHHAINRDWQRLNFVLERRERLIPYNASAFVALPLASEAELIRNLRYAAGVELAVMQEYLTAAWSLKPPANQPQPLIGDLRAAFAELLRIAIGEMRHLRAVNDVLSAFAPAGTFQPALGVAARIPDRTPGTFRPTALRPATPDVIDDFIAIEAPSLSVDGLYSRILATMEGGIGTDEQEQTIRTVMAEGEDHWQTFLFIREWLGRHQPTDYLRAVNLQPPPAGNPAHQTLQQRYLALLEKLHEGYRLGIPAGAPDINAARTEMLAPDGIRGAMDAVAAQNFLAVFDPIADPRFAAINPP
jgi:hypothetical protein